MTTFLNYLNSETYLGLQLSREERHRVSLLIAFV